MYSIGRSEDMFHTLENPSVSRHHADLYKEGQEWYLKDKQSTNGTKVNGRKVEIHKLEKGDVIVFGDEQVDADTLLLEIQKKINADRTDFTHEYEKLFDVYKEYERKQDKIMKKPLGPILLRIGLGIGLILVLIFIPFKNPEIKTTLYILVGLSSVVASAFSKPVSKRNADLGELVLEYENRLKCPKCNYTVMTKFGSTYLKGKGTCLNKQCDAIFNIDEKE